MTVLINFKICDNAKECNGIAICPTGTITWNEKKKTIEIDNSKCISCGKCETSCSVGAIRVARNDQEYKKIKKEFDEDPRKVSDLFVDRYGAQTIQQAFLIPDNRFSIEVLESNKLTVVEFFNNNSIKCLLNSIPIKDLFKDFDIKYRRLVVKDDSLLKKYEIKELPSLLFFNNGKLVGKIEGHYRIGKVNELKKKVEDVIKQIK
jgi:NAD-dependent dihydropyrimidine dehydrogenase PreA subunit